MNPEWNTPPDGDFARYVERLTAQMAQAAQPRGEAQMAQPRGEAQPTAGNLIDEPAERTRIQAHQMVTPGFAASAATVADKPRAVALPALLGGLVAALLVLLVLLQVLFNASGLVLFAVAAAFVWIAFSLRRLFAGGAAIALRQRLEEAARRQAERRR